jgi:hypothetical protein
MILVDQRRLGLIVVSLLLLLPSCVSDGESMGADGAIMAEGQREEPEMSEVDGERCPVHGVPLRRDEVPVVYGLIKASPGFLKAQKAYFPLARTFISGGCVVDHERTQESVEYCPKCREALRAWNDSCRRAGKAGEGTPK